MKRATLAIGAALAILLASAACLPQPNDPNAGITLVAVDGGSTYYGQWSSSFPDASSFFPITVFNADGVSGEAAKYKANGVNTIFNWYSGYSTQMQSEVQANQPMYVIDGLSGGNRSPYAEVKAIVSGDEPDGNGFDFCGGQPDYLKAICKAIPNSGTIGYPDFMRGRTDPQTLNQMADEMRRRDTTRPVVNQFTKPVALGEGVYDPYRAQYLARSDILSFDFYPLTDPYEPNAKLADQYDAVQNMRKLSSFSKPVWAFLEPTAIFTNGRTKPTPAQINAETWHALIGGARGISWFKNDFSPGGTNNIFLDSRYSSVVSQINATDSLVTTLAPVLNGDYANNFATVQSGQVHYTVKYSGNAYWIIAATTSLQNQPTVTFKFVTTGSGTDTRNVEVYNEGRTVTATNGVFSDSFAPETSVHIYKVS